MIVGSLMQQSYKKLHGFSLIELMIVVVIIGILAAIAYPGYQQHVRTSNRADAAANLLALSQSMERFFTERGSYLDAGGNPPVLDFTTSPRNAANPKYNIALAATVNTYTLTATTAGPQVADNAKCGNLSVNQVGIRCAFPGAVQHCSDVVAQQAVVEDCW